MLPDSVYRQGMTGVQATGDAQFWSFSNPASTPGYANAMGMPAGPSTGYLWTMGGTVRPGVRVVTRPAPGIGSKRSANGIFLFVKVVGTMPG